MLILNVRPRGRIVAVNRLKLNYEALHAQIKHRQNLAPHAPNAGPEIWCNGQSGVARIPEKPSPVALVIPSVIIFRGCKNIENQWLTYTEKRLSNIGIGVSGHFSKSGLKLIKLINLINLINGTFLPREWKDQIPEE